MARISNNSDAFGRAIGIIALNGFCIYFLFVPEKRGAAIAVLSFFWGQLFIFWLLMRKK
jgi:hypothetical protein